MTRTLLWATAALLAAAVSAAAQMAPLDVELSSPAEGASVSSTVVVSAEVSGGNGVSGVQFFLDGSPLGVVAATAPYATDWNTASVPDGTYLLNAVAWDRSNASSTSTLVSVTVENAPPALSAFAAAAVSQTTATVTWNSNSASDSQVNYGTSTAYGLSAPYDGALVSNHSVTLVGLSSGTLYHYQVQSRDAAGVQTTSADQVFTTAAQPASAASASAAPAFWVAAHYTGWNSASMPASDVDFTSLDAVINFAVVPNSDGSLNASSNGLSAAETAALVSAAHNAGRKVLFTVGGAQSEPAFEAAMSAAVLPAFVKNLVAYMTANQYDGIDVDMEPMDSADAAPYEAFITSLRAQMEAAAPGSLLSADAAWEPAVFAQLAGDFDHIDLMSYSLAGTWLNQTWHNAPVLSSAAGLPSADSMVSRFTAAGVPASKLGIGVSFDGYVWSGGSGVERPQQDWSSAPTAMETAFHAIADTYGLAQDAAASPQYRWDAGAQAAYLSVAGASASQDAFVSFDDQAAVSAKVAYARAHGLGGLFIWNLEDGWRSSQPAGSQGYMLASVNAALSGNSAAAGGGTAGAPSSQASPPEQAKAPQKFLSPAKQDGINDDAVFGPDAREVSIFDLRGKRVFHASRSAGGSPIVWDCRDGSGQLLESGVYVAQVITLEDKREYQSFAIVK